LSKPSEQKKKAHEKKSNKYGKRRRAYIAWEDNDASSSDSSQKDVEANLCLTAGQNSEVSSDESLFSLIYLSFCTYFN